MNDRAEQRNLFLYALAASMALWLGQEIEMIIGQAFYAVVWDGRGFYRRDPEGRRLFVFRAVSPYPDDNGEERYGVASTEDECVFGDGAPWTTRRREHAFRFANGVWA
uniref:Uncharacterized protein n=1 Tax=viral metagenome TaxID=1070528 RepID=A0A6M3JJW7_9ZZZZ